MKNIKMKEFVEALGGNGSVLGFHTEAETIVIACYDEFKLFDRVHAVETKLTEFSVISVGKNTKNPTHVLTETCFENSIKIPLRIFFSAKEVYLTPIETWSKVQTEVVDLLLF